MNLWGKIPDSSINSILIDKSDVYRLQVDIYTCRRFYLQREFRDGLACRATIEKQRGINVPGIKEGFFTVSYARGCP